MSEVLVIGDLEFEVRRSSRRKTLGLTVDRSGELVVHSPETISSDQLRHWVGKKLLWVHQKLLRKEEQNRGAHDLEMVSGETIPYLGQNYRLRMIKDQPTSLYFDGEWFILREADKQDAAKHFQSWYQDVGTEWLNKRVQFWEPRVGTSASKIVVSDLGFRWGSCGKNGVLHFNWKLFQLSVFLLDYVVAHELVHLREKNHTPEFWRTLGRALPDWRERKEALSYRRPQMI